MLYGRVRKLCCLLLAMTITITGALFSQPSPWNTDCANINNNDNECAPIDCPPLNNEDARRYRGTPLDLTDCPVVRTPPPPTPAPVLTCPIRQIMYSEVDLDASTAYRSYKAFPAPDFPAGSTNPADSALLYTASSQGWVNQLYCGADGFGLPAPPPGCEFSTEKEFTM